MYCFECNSRYEFTLSDPQIFSRSMPQELHQPTGSLIQLELTSYSCERLPSLGRVRVIDRTSDGLVDHGQISSHSCMRVWIPRVSPLTWLERLVTWERSTCTCVHHLDLAAPVHPRIDPHRSDFASCLGHPGNPAESRGLRRSSRPKSLHGRHRVRSGYEICSCCASNSCTILSPLQGESCRRRQVNGRERRR